MAVHDPNDLGPSRRIAVNAAAHTVGASETFNGTDIWHEDPRDTSAPCTPVQPTRHKQKGSSSRDTNTAGQRFASRHGQNPNHYHGSQSLANYGWININEQWVDPDGEGDVDNAWKGILTYDASKAAFPEAVQSARVLPDTELKGLYGAFEDFVSDDEGKPEQNHITPEAFMTMAGGAKKGFHHELVMPQFSVSRSLYRRYERRGCLG